MRSNYWAPFHQNQPSPKPSPATGSCNRQCTAKQGKGQVLIRILLLQNLESECVFNGEAKTGAQTWNGRRGWDRWNRWNPYARGRRSKNDAKLNSWK